VTNWYQSHLFWKITLAPWRNQAQEQVQFQEKIKQLMAGVTEQTQGMTDMMKKILDGFNDLKASQIETHEALRDRRVASSPPTPTAATTDSGAAAGQGRSATAPSLGTTNNRSSDHRAANLFRGDDGIKQCATSMGLQVQSVVVRVKFSHERTRDLISNSRGTVEKALFVLVRQPAKKIFLSCVPNSIEWLSSTRC
jgi:hypothetical protein